MLQKKYPMHCSRYHKKIYASTKKAEKSEKRQILQCVDTKVCVGWGCDFACCLRLQQRYSALEQNLTFIFDFNSQKL